MLQVTNEKTFSFAYNSFLFAIAAAASTVVTVFIIDIVL